ncbi:MAG TPA: hypothetical protein VGB04_07455 [Allosphingosinicella sp.]
MTNPGFEAPPARADGDAYYASNSGNLTGWTIEGGASANVVQVDGSGGYTYSNGPEQDASNAPAGTPQRYLDFGTANKSVYQSFTAPCSATFRFGASFSDRSHAGGSGQTMVLAGNGPNGALLASSPTVTIAANGSYAWQPSAGSVSLVGNQVYTFRIVMDENYMNTDQAFVTQAGACVQTVDVPGDHYQCYRVVRGAALPPQPIAVADQFGRSRIVLARPVMLCNPSAKVHREKDYPVKSPELHLVCYEPAREPRPRVRRVRIGNQFQVADLHVAERAMFCVPSNKKLLDGRESPLN